MFFDDEKHPVYGTAITDDLCIIYMFKPDQGQLARARSIAHIIWNKASKIKDEEERNAINWRGRVALSDESYVDLYYIYAHKVDLQPREKCDYLNEPCLLIMNNKEQSNAIWQELVSSESVRKLNEPSIPIPLSA